MHGHFSKPIVGCRKQALTRQLPTVVAQWCRRRATDHKDRGSVVTALAALQIEAKGEHSCAEVSEHVKYPGGQIQIRSPALRAPHIPGVASAG